MDEDVSEFGGILDPVQNETSGASLWSTVIFLCLRFVSKIRQWKENSNASSLSDLLQSHVRFAVFIKVAEIFDAAGHCA